MYRSANRNAPSRGGKGNSGKSMTNINMVIPPRQGRNGFDEKLASAQQSALGCFAFVGVAAYARFSDPLPAIYYPGDKALSGSIIVMSLVGLFQGITWYLTSAATEPPSMDPHFYCSTVKPSSSKSCLVMLGDSITHQGLSGRFCDMIQAKRGDLDVVNCGQNSILTYTVLKERVAWVAACDPAYVSVMIGTNDVKGIYKKEWGDGSRVTWEFPEGEIVDWEAFGRNIEMIVDYLVRNTTAAIGVSTLLMMGEDLECDANVHIRKGNAIIRKAVEGAGKGKGKGRVILVDCYEVCAKYLMKTTSSAERKKGLKVDDFGSVGPELAIRTRFLGHSYDAVSAKFGLKIMCDALHLNERGATLVADKVLLWLRSISH